MPVSTVIFANARTRFWCCSDWTGYVDGWLKNSLILQCLKGKLADDGLGFCGRAVIFFFLFPLQLYVCCCVKCLQMALQIGWISTCYVFHACPAVADRIHIDDDAFTIVTIYQVFEILPHTAVWSTTGSSGYISMIWLSHDVEFADCRVKRVDKLIKLQNYVVVRKNQKLLFLNSTIHGRMQIQYFLVSFQFIPQRIEIY